MRTKSPILVGVLTILFACIFIAFSVRGLDRDGQFERSELKGTATIEHLWTTHSGRHGTSYHVKYRYESDGVTHEEANICVASATYAELQVGQQVPIKLLPQDATATRIDWPGEFQWQKQNDKMGLAIGVFIAIFGALIGCLGKHVGGAASDNRERV